MTKCNIGKGILYAVGRTIKTTAFGGIGKSSSTALGLRSLLSQRGGRRGLGKVFKEEAINILNYGNY